MKKIIIVILVIISLSCQTSNNRVTRIDSNITTDLSGRWNDTDSRLVSEAMVSELLNHKVITKLTNKYGREPVLIIGELRNKSSEHISITTLVKDIEREFVNSGDVRIVASRLEREEIRIEKEDQQSNSTFDSAKRLAQETGADVMLIGNITTIKDQIDNTRVVFYQIDLELIDLESNVKLWIGSNKHKKVINLGGNKW